MLTSEIQHLNQQSKNHQTQIHKIMRETREYVNKDSLYNSVSIDHSIMLPHISNDEAHHNSFSNPLDSVRNKLAQLNMSSDNATKAHRKQMVSEGNQGGNLNLNKTDLDRMSKRNKIK